MKCNVMYNQCMYNQWPDQWQRISEGRKLYLQANTDKFSWNVQMQKLLENRMPVTLFSLEIASVKL